MTAGSQIIKTDFPTAPTFFPSSYVVGACFLHSFNTCSMHSSKAYQSLKSSLFVVHVFLLVSCFGVSATLWRRCKSIATSFPGCS